MIIYTYRHINLLRMMKSSNEMMARVRKDLDKIYEKNVFYKRALHILDDKVLKKLKR